MKIILNLTFLITLISICNSPALTQNATEELDSILQKIELLWTTKYSCDSLQLHEPEVYDANGVLALFNRSLKTYEFQKELIPFEQKIKSLIELHNDCLMAGGRAWKCKSRYPKWNWNFKLRWQLKYLLYSIDYIGLSDKNQFDKVISKIPFLLKNKRYGAIQLNFERDLIYQVVPSLTINHLIESILAKDQWTYQLVFKAVKSLRTKEEYKYFIEEINKQTKN